MRDRSGGCGILSLVSCRDCLVIVADGTRVTRANVFLPPLPIFMDYTEAIEERWLLTQSIWNHIHFNAKYNSSMRDPFF